MFSLIPKNKKFTKFVLNDDETLLKLSKEKKENLKQIKVYIHSLLDNITKEEIEVQLQLIDNVVMEYQLNKLEIKICEIKKDILLQKLEDIIVKSKLHKQESNDYYPKLTNPNFNTIINEKKEFQK